MWNQENEMPHVLVRFLRLCVGAKRQDLTKLASSVEPVNKASLDAPHREPQAQFTREEKLAEIRREIASRKTDYPGLVREQRMSLSGCGRTCCDHGSDCAGLRVGAPNGSGKRGQASA